MSAETPEEIRKHARIYWVIGLALMVLTIVTVLVSYLDLGFAGNVALALFIASFKVSLVAGIFMHLISEKQLIYWILLMTVGFFAVLMSLPVITATGNFGLHLH